MEEIDSMKVNLPKFTALKNDILKINKENHSKMTEEMKHYCSSGSIHFKC